MEALKAQIQAKKRAASEQGGEGAKYVRRGESHAQASPVSESPPGPSAPRTVAPSGAPSASAHVATPSPAETVGTATGAKKTFTVSNEEAVRRLRQKGEPIRLFAESDNERALRLRALELVEEHTAELPGGKDFLRILHGTDEGLARVHRHKAEAQAADHARIPAREREGAGMHSLLDLELVKTDTARVYPMIYYTLKGLLEEWGEVLNKRPGTSAH